MFKNSNSEPCPWCGKVISITGLIGDDSNRCPRCGLPVFGRRFDALDVGDIFIDGRFRTKWVKVDVERATACEDDGAICAGSNGEFQKEEVVYVY